MIETKFKQTEIGLIPEDWKVCNIGSIANNFTGLTYSPNNVSKFGTLVLRSSNIQNDVLCFNNNVFVSMHIPDRAKAKLGDVLICVRNGSKELIGKSALVTANGMAFGAFMTVLRAQTINPKFLLFLWRSDFIQKQIKSSLGATINQITNADIKRYIVALPPPKEQSNIANVLTDIDSLLLALDNLIAKKKSIKEGTMQQLLTGKKRLKGFEEPWVEKKLGEVVVVKRGVRVVKRQLIKDTLFPVFQNTTIPLGYFNKNNVKGGTPFVIIGGSAGQIGICETDYWAADDCAYFDCGETMSKKFLYFLLLFHQREIQNNVRCASVPRLDRKALVDLLVSVPSPLEQQSIAQVLTNMDSEISALEAKRKKYESVKQGMMQQLLTGKIRLTSTLKTKNYCFSELECDYGIVAEP